MADETFKQSAVPLTNHQAIQAFIAGSRQALDHLRLAALAQIRKSLERHRGWGAAEKTTRRERETASAFLAKLSDAYQVWGKRQTDQKDVTPETFAEQVAYVFFVRLLLVRVLEDKAILQPRLVSDGGFRDWSDYIGKHFQELADVGMLNQNYCSLLTQKAGLYYLHFFQRDVFD